MPYDRRGLGIGNRMSAQVAAFCAPWNIRKWASRNASRPVQANGCVLTRSGILPCLSGENALFEAMRSSAPSLCLPPSKASSCPAVKRRPVARRDQRVLRVFGEARAHHAWLFANRRATCLKLWAHDGFDLRLCARRLHQRRFHWATKATRRSTTGTGRIESRRLRAGERTGCYLPVCRRFALERCVTSRQSFPGKAKRDNAPTARLSRAHSRLT